MSAPPVIPDYNKLMGGVDLFRPDEQLLFGLEEVYCWAIVSFQLPRNHYYQLVHLVSKLFRQQGEFAYMGCLVDIIIHALLDQS